MRRNIGLAVAALLGSTAIGSVAWAQDAAGIQGATSPQADAASADIIVTAQRREESLSRTPVAVQFIGADALQRAQVRTQDDLRAVATGLSIRAGVDSNELNFAVRGQSKDPLSETEPGVVPYLNEVPLGGGKIGASVFYDLASVQLLRGPQGTLFGRSATGGAVLYTTMKPQTEFEGNIGGSIGNYALRSIDGAVNVPIVDDTVLFRFAGIYRERNGFQTNIFPGGGREGDTRRWGIRPSLTLASGPFRNELVVDHINTDGSAFTPVISGLLPFTGQGAPFVPATLLYGGTNDPVARAIGIGTIGAFLGGTVPEPVIAGYYDAYFAPGTGRNPGGLTQELIDQRKRGPFTINSDGRLFYKQKSTAVTNLTELELGDETTLRNIFGYITTDWTAAYNSDGTPFGLGNHYLPRILGLPTIEGFNGEDYRQFTEELQLQGTTLSGKLKYSTGLFFSDESRDFFNYQPFFDILLGGQTQTNSYRIKSRSYAIYGQGTYQLTDSGLSLTAGLRYTITEPRKILLPDDSFAVANPVPPPGFSYDQKSRFNHLSYQLGMQYQANDNLLLYAVTRRAYKPGGFNGTVVPRVGDASIAGDGFDEEKVSDFEVGAKFQGRIGNVPARMSVAGFQFWTENSQRLAFTLVNGNPSSLTVNVPRGDTTGFEVEGQISPASWLSLGGIFNYVDARFAATPVLVNGDSQIYNQVPDTPKVTTSAFADLTFPVSDSLSVLLHGDVYYQSTSYIVARSAANDGATIEAYTLVNFRAGVQGADDRWSLTANLKNAFNRTYYTGGLATGEIFQVNVLVPAEPRTFSIDARFNF